MGLIVTGGSSGIGKAVLDALSSRMETLNIDINSQNPVDVRDYSAVFKAIGEFVCEGKNFLLSNAGVAFFTDALGEAVDFANAPITQLHDMVDINLKGQINVLKAFIGSVMEKGGTGNIVVVSSISAFHSGGPNMAVYDATKAAVTALALRLVAYQSKGIRINVIQPGSVRSNIGGWNTDFSVNEHGLRIVKEGQDGDQRKLGDEVSVEEIVNSVKFLFFENHGMNGAVMTIDKGLTLVGRENY